MQRHVPPSSREVHGAVLEVSTTGGYSVHHKGAYLGYIHATVGGWNTYRRVADGPDDWLGKFPQDDDAVYKILAASGRAAS